MVGCGAGFITDGRAGAGKGGVATTEAAWLVAKSFRKSAMGVSATYAFSVAVPAAGISEINALVIDPSRSAIACKFAISDSTVLSSMTTLYPSVIFVSAAAVCPRVLSTIGVVATVVSGISPSATDVVPITVSAREFSSSSSATVCKLASVF